MPKPINTVAPSITGASTDIGETVVGHRGTWTGTLGYRYRWFYENLAGDDVTLIYEGVMTGTTTELVIPRSAALDGWYLRFEVTGTNYEGGRKVSSDQFGEITNPGGGAALTIYLPLASHRYRAAVCEKDGVHISYILDPDDNLSIWTERDYEFHLGMPRMITGKVPAAHENIGDLHTDDFPKLCKLRRSLKVWREERNGDGSYDWDIIFAGQIRAVEAAGDIDGVGYVSFVAYDPMVKLSDVYVRDAADDPTAPVSWTGTNAEVIIKALIDRAQDRAGGELGIQTATGVFETCAPRDHSVQQQTVYEAISPLINAYAGCDIWLQPLDRTDGKHAELNVYVKRYRDLGGETIFGWGKSHHTIEVVTHPQGDTPANDVLAIGDTKTTFGHFEDTDSKDDIGPFEAVEEYSDISVPAFLEDLARGRVEIGAYGVDRLKFTPRSGLAGIDYRNTWHVGDFVTLTTDGSLLGGFDGLVRIYGVKITITDEGTEQITEIITHPEQVTDPSMPSLVRASDMANSLSSLNARLGRLRRKAQIPGPAGHGGGSAAFYGDGEDGDVVLSSDTTLTRDMYYNSLDLNGYELDTAGFCIYVKDSTTIRATSALACDGADSADPDDAPEPVNATAGAAGKGGGAAADLATDVLHSLGGSGGLGQPTIDPGFAVPPPDAEGGLPNNLLSALTRMTQTGARFTGGGGGCGGNRFTTAPFGYVIGGGGGAAGGGIVALYTRNLIVEPGAVVRARGGNGFDCDPLHIASAPAYASGGGGGGSAIIVYSSEDGLTDLTFDFAGGTGGNSPAISGGADGGDGDPGTGPYVFQMAVDSPDVETVGLEGDVLTTSGGVTVWAKVAYANLTTALKSLIDGKADQADLDTEVSDRTAADTALLGVIGAEAATRATADALKADLTDSRFTDARTPLPGSNGWWKTAGGVLTKVTSLVVADISDAGTAATKNVAASGDAASGEVVKGNDSRLTDARTPAPGSDGWWKTVTGVLTKVSTLDAGDVTTGTMATARLGSGAANATTILFGDQSYKKQTVIFEVPNRTPSGGAVVVTIYATVAMTLTNVGSFKDDSGGTISSVVVSYKKNGGSDVAGPGSTSPSAGNLALAAGDVAKVTFTYAGSSKLTTAVWGTID